ncbi:aromatic ring-hydroxylating oxygenase subunit alpha [Novosphingobium sp. NRRL B-2648]|uniref:aromatic ring-hydroxylating oxygenase subunit alpha n=1 Tax=Novosphingobium TaxID=165696 RepID=UPI002329F9D8|nr:ring-hydroxylating oxygenase subunit alpha [Novosphingobium resinovorum]
MTADPSLAPSAARRDSHNSLRRALVERLRDGRTDLAETVMEIDAHAYVDPERHAREREAFRKLPIMACLSLDVAEPGDKLLFDALGPEIVILRDGEGQVRAFLNMCPHRAARLVTECDSRKRMTCRFHGWTFDLKGKLIGLPGAEGFAGMERAARGLVELPVTEWAGMVFVRADPEGGPIDVAQWLGPFAAELEHLELGRARPMRRSRLETRTNWKCAWDTYCESYHFATLHATTVAPRLVSNVMALTPFDRNARMGFPRKDWYALADAPETEWPDENFGGNYFIFPNINLNVSSGPNGEMFYGFYHLYPGETPGSTVTRMATYRPGHADGPQPDEDWQVLHGFIEDVVRTEDYSVSEEAYRNLSNAPEGFSAVFGANEILVQKWHRDWADQLEELGLGEA